MKLLLLSLLALTTIASAASWSPKSASKSNLLKERLPNQVNALSQVNTIRSFEPKAAFYMLTFWETNQVFRVSHSNDQIPCLENSFKANRPVTVEIDQKSNMITDCKMFGGTHPGMRRSTDEGAGESQVIK